MSLDLYRPPRPEACPPAPIVVWVHGGGSDSGDKANNMADKVRHLTGLGWVVVSVNYRLAETLPPTGPLPYAIQRDDLAAAVAWLLENAAGFGGDATRLAVVGHSYGAALTAGITTDPSYLRAHDTDVAAVRCAAPLDTEALDVEALMAGGGRTARNFERAFGTDPDVWSAASPINHIDRGSQVPPMFLVTRGGPDRARTVERFAAELEAAGGAATVLDAHALSHAEVSDALGRPDDTLLTPALTAFLTECFARPPQGPEPERP